MVTAAALPPSCLDHLALLTERLALSFPPPSAFQLPHGRMSFQHVCTKARHRPHRVLHAGPVSDPGVDEKIEGRVDGFFRQAKARGSDAALPCWQGIGDGKRAHDAIGALGDVGAQHPHPMCTTSLAMHPHQVHDV